MHLYLLQYFAIERSEGCDKAAPTKEPVKQKFQIKIVIIFLSIRLNLCLGCSKDLIETVLFSTHNICFG